MGELLARLVLTSAASLAVLHGAERLARAQETCARLAAPPDLPAGWANAARDLAIALAELPAAECMPMTLSLEPSLEPRDGAMPGMAGIRIVAQTRDGRRAIRSIHEPFLLVPVALGLVQALPPEGAAVAPTPRQASSTPPSTPADARSAPPGEAKPGHPLSADPAGAASAATVWLAVGIGARLGVPSTIPMADVEARADVRLGRTLLFASFRDVPVGFVAGQGVDGDAYHESSFALGIGHTFVLGVLLLDVSIEPSFVFMRLSKDAPVRARANDVELRLGASARLNVPLSPSWRLTFTADTDVIPDLLTSEERIDPLPAFPSWTSGLRLGVSGAVL